MVDEGQAAPFAAQRAVADAGEVGVAVEAFALEHRHHALVLHAAVADDGVEDDLAVGIHVLQFMPGDVLEECRHGEDSSCTEPTAHVVA